jgi:archaellum component FlaC
VKILILRAIRAHLSVYDSASMYRMDWTDDRLQERFDSIDHRFDEVDRRFGEVDRRFDGVDRRIDDLDQRVEKRFDKVDGELKRLDSKIDGLQRTLVYGVISLTSAFVAGLTAMIVLVATQI